MTDQELHRFLDAVIHAAKAESVNAALDLLRPHIRTSEQLKMIIEEKAKLETEVATLKGKLDVARGSYDNVSQQREDWKHRHELAHAQVEDVRHELDRAKEQISRLQQDVEKAEYENKNWRDQAGSDKTLVDVNWQQYDQLRKLRPDAERWRKLMNSGRIRIVGHGSLGKPGMQHVGFSVELWDKFPHDVTKENKYGRETITTFVDSMPNDQPDTAEKDELYR